MIYGRTGFLTVKSETAVTLTQPAASIVIDPDAAAYCTGITVTVGGRDV